MIQIYTGDGKGKTTAALGLILRAVACGMKVAYVQFDKGGKHYSERKIFAERFPEVDMFSTGLDRMEDGRFRFGVTEEDRQEGERGLQIIKDVFNQDKYSLIVLDELNVAVSLGIVDEDKALEILRDCPKNLEIAITGRNAPKSFIEMADLVTEMKMNKHYIQQGIKARYGLDY
ncbi:MAG: cob(I)yrinic acid a,c-diamide adenosyltransferase [Patescibacteria group bacterium]|nr:cob(I)yrinic acid a,c-diamide adenosyltransferase [Patescibacteria group bacterium]